MLAVENEPRCRHRATTNSDWLYDLYLREPDKFAVDMLGVEAWDRHPELCAQQIDMLRSVFRHRKTAVKSGHKTGKTFTLAVAALTFLHLYRPSVVITTAPTNRQVKELLWQEIHRLYRQAEAAGRPLGGELLECKYKISPGHFAIGFSTDKQDAGVKVQGWSGENVLIVFDEAGGVPREVWEVANTALQAPNARMIAAGNPHDAATPFYDTCLSNSWHTITMSSWDSPNARTGQQIIPGLASREWCQEMLEEWGEESPVYQFRVLGEFPAAGSKTLIRLAWCEAARDRAALPPGYRCGGCDVARFGEDKTVVIGLNGGHVETIERVARWDTVEVAGKVTQMYRAHNWESIAIDDTGLNGVSDQLARAGLNVIRVNFGSKAFDDGAYGNIATEMFALLARTLKDGELSGLPRHGDLFRELTGRQYSFTLKQQMRLESKEDFKSRIGHSPDDGDALMLANYARHLANSGAAVIGQVFA